MNASRTESQIYNDHVIQICRVATKYPNDTDVQKIWETMREYEAARREVLGFAEAPKINEKQKH